MLIIKLIAGIIVLITVLVFMIVTILTNIITLFKKNESKKEKAIAVFNIIFVIALIIYFTF